MKCIDPWLLNNRRQCPVCKRYVFPNHDNSDEEESNGPAATERTPLIQPSNDDPVTSLSRNHQTGKYVKCHYEKSLEFNASDTTVDHWRKYSAPHQT